MSGWRFLDPARVAKTGMVLSLAAFALLVALNNLVDYGSNFAFVHHVLSMDTTFPGNGLLGRALPFPWAWHASYWLIIATEMLTGLLFAIAGIGMARRIRADQAAFARARRLVPLATLCGFLLWFLGFSVIGAEWFAMWQSPRWNGQEPAFRFVVVMLAVLIYTGQPE